MAAAVRSGSYAFVSVATAPVPTGLANGDIWVVFAARPSNSTPPTLGAGFTDLGTVAITTPGSVRLAYKIITNAAGEVGVAFTNATRIQSFAIQGADTTTQPDVASTGASSAINATSPALALTTVTNDALLVYMDLLASAQTQTAATSPLVALTGASQISQGATGSQAVAGASGNKTITIGTASQHSAMMVAFRSLVTTVNASSSGTKGTVTVAGTVGSTTATTNASSTGTAGTVTATGYTGSTSAVQNASSTGTAGTVTATGTVGSTTAQANASSSSTKGTATVTGNTGSTTATTNASSSGTVGAVTAAGTVGSTTAQRHASSTGVAGTVTATGYVGTTDIEPPFVIVALKHPISFAQLGTPWGADLDVQSDVPGATITHMHLAPTGPLAQLRPVPSTTIRQVSLPPAGILNAQRDAPTANIDQLSLAPATPLLQQIGA